MKIFSIKNQKDFTGKLFTGDVFDSFLLVEANFVKDHSIFIDGHYTGDEERNDEYVLWKDAKQLAFDTLKGSKLPKSFKIVLKLTKENAINTQKSLELDVDSAAGFYLNIKYSDKAIICTTGTSTASFVISRDLEKGWDGFAEKFLELKQIEFDKEM